MGGTLYFTASDGTGRQLWQYDGSNLTEVKVGTYPTPQPIIFWRAAVGNTLYFTAEDGRTRQLWQYDGNRLSEINIGTAPEVDPCSYAMGGVDPHWPVST